MLPSSHLSSLPPACISVCLRACAIVSQLTAQYVTKSKSKSKLLWEVDSAHRFAQRQGGGHWGGWGVGVGDVAWSEPVVWADALELSSL